MTISIVRRKLTESDITTLVENIRQFPNIAYVSPNRWQNFAHPYCALIDGTFAGVCALYTFKKWTKLGPLVVLSKYHGVGVGKKLLNTIINDHKHTSICIASSSPAVQHMLTAYNFRQISHFFSLPISVQLLFIRQLFEQLNVSFVCESIRKKLFLRRGRIKFFVKLA